MRFKTLQRSIVLGRCRLTSKSFTFAVVVEHQQISKYFLGVYLLLLEWPMTELHDLFTFVDERLAHVEQQASLECFASVQHCS